MIFFFLLVQHIFFEFNVARCRKFRNALEGFEYNDSTSPCVPAKNINPLYLQLNATVQSSR